MQRAEISIKKKQNTNVTIALHFDVDKCGGVFFYLECDCMEGQLNKSVLLFSSGNSPEYEDSTGVCTATTGVFNDELCPGLF